MSTQTVIDETQLIASLSAYLPIDRRFALAEGRDLPDRARGAALFADMSGFTKLSAELSQELGLSHGAEVLTQQINDVYRDLIEQVHRYRGSVIGFSGDAITCWFNETGSNLEDFAEAAWRAVTCAMEMQTAIKAGGGKPVVANNAERPGVKIAVTAGPVRRFAVGHPSYRRIDTLAGVALDRLAGAERQALTGEVVVDTWTLNLIGDHLNVSAERSLTGNAWVGVVEGLKIAAETYPWPSPPDLPQEVAKDWVIKPIYRRTIRGEEEYLAQLRTAAALFGQFSGIDYDVDDEAEAKLDAYTRWLQSVIARHFGYLMALTIGDKGSYFQASFGAPTAYGPDLENALRAALELRQTPEEFGFVEDICIGIDYGAVYTGTYGSPRRKTYGIHGDHVNIAARLMVEAETGEILVPRQAANRAENLFNFGHMGQIEIRGLSKPILVSSLLHSKLSDTAENDEDISLFIVGREAEREKFEQQLDKLESGVSGAAIIEGEAGIGKTRLTEYFIACAQQRSLKIMTGAGTAQERTTAYHAWRSIYRQLLGITEADSLEFTREQVMNLLQTSPEMAMRAPLINAVLPAGLADNELTASLTGEVRASNTAALLIWLLENHRQDREPLVLVMEDAHWLDSSSWALLDRLRREMSNLLILIVTRPPSEQPAKIPDIYEAITSLEETEEYLIKALTPDDISRLVSRRLAVDHIPAEISDFIYRRAEGHPFFSEELAFALRDAGIIESDGDSLTLKSKADLEELAFPVTIQGVITSRIDHLAPGEDLALKVASVIGRVFLLRTLKDVHPVQADLAQIDDYVSNLAELDITPLESKTPEPTYIFRHAFTQEVAYSLLLFRQRQELHRSVAQWYESTHPDELVSIYPVLANHWRKGKDVPRAVYYLEAAGIEALRNSSNLEAVNFLNGALSISRGIPGLKSHDGRPVDDLRKAGWMRRLGEAYLGLGQLPESRSNLLKMLALVKKAVPESKGRLALGIIWQVLVQVAHRMLPFLYLDRIRDEKETVYLEAARSFQQLAVIYYFANERLQTLNAGLNGLNLTEAASPSPELARAYGNMVVISGLIPWHGAAEAYSRRALSTAEAVGDQSAIVWVNLLVGTYRIGLGQWQQVTSLTRKAIDLSRELGDFRVMGLSTGLYALVPNGQGRFEDSLVFYKEWHRIASEALNVQHQAFSLFGQAENLVPQNKIQEAIPLIEEGLHLLVEKAEKSFENRTAAIRAYGLMAIAKFRLGEQAEALQAANETMAVVDLLSAPTRVTLFDGLSGAAETYLRLWQLQLEGHQIDQDLGAAAKRAVDVLGQFARVFRIGKPRALIYQGLYLHLSGQSQKARKALMNGAATARELGMPYEEALALLELGRLESGSKKDRFQQQADQILSALGIEKPQDISGRAIDKL